MDDLAVAFAMRIDEQSLTYEQGLRAAEDLAGDLMQAAEDRESYATREELA